MTYLPDKLVESMESLKFFCIFLCPNLVSIPDFYGLRSLHTLEIISCWRLSTLPKGLEECSSLLFVDINTCRSLNPESLKCLTSLNLRVLNLGGFSYELKDFPWPSTSSNTDTSDSVSGLSTLDHHFASVVSLKLYGWPRLISLPKQIQYLSSLRTLRIHQFDGLIELPNWIGNLTRLERLDISFCEYVMSLPSAKAMQRLTNLRKLYIRKCPILAERLADESHREHHKIVHIPEVEIKD